MKSYTRMCFIAVLALMAAAAFAEPMTLAYKFTPGDVDNYKMSMEMSMQMPGMPAPNTSVTVTYTQKVLSVNPDGSAKIQVTYGAPTLSGAPAAAKGAKAAAKLEGQSVIMTMSPRGQMLSMEGLDKIVAGSAMKNMDFSSLFSNSSNQALFPEGPVDVGQSWSQDVPFPFGGGQMKITSTLEDADMQIWNQKAVKIKQTFTGCLNMAQVMKAAMAGVDSTGKTANMPDLSKMMGDMNLDGDMTFLFAPEIGKLLKGDGAVKMNVVIAMPSDAKSHGTPSTFKMDMTMTIHITKFK